MALLVAIFVAAVLGGLSSGGLVAASLRSRTHCYLYSFLAVLCFLVVVVAVPSLMWLLVDNS